MTEEKKQTLESDIEELANIIFGESADQPDEVMEMVGSSVIQRLLSKKTKEFGGTIKEIGEKAYYAVKNKNIPYTQAITKNFPDLVSATKYQNAKRISAGLLDGSIPLQDVMFFFKPDEYEGSNENGFDFSKVRETGKSGPYDLWSY